MILTGLDSRERCTSSVIFCTAFYLFLPPPSSLPECRRIHIVQLNDPVHGQTQMEQEGEGP